MKTLFLEARHEKKIVLPKKLIAMLPKKVALFTTVQFIDGIKNIIKDIKSTGREVIKIKPSHCKYECQLLGCSVTGFRQGFDAFLYLGDGMFHPKALLLKNERPVFVYNPFSEKFYEIGKKDIEEIKKRQKGALLKFYSSKEIGILISTKPGQYNIKSAEKLKNKFKDKNFYFLIADTFDFQSLEDFPFIECFVNTACKRISYDDGIKISKPIIGVEELI